MKKTIIIIMFMLVMLVTIGSSLQIGNTITQEQFLNFDFENTPFSINSHSVEKDNEFVYIKFTYTYFDLSDKDNFLVINKQRSVPYSLESFKRCMVKTGNKTYCRSVVVEILKLKIINYFNNQRYLLISVQDDIRKSQYSDDFDITGLYEVIMPNEV